MKKYFFILVLLILSEELTYAQNLAVVEWNDIKKCTVCSYGTHKDIQKEKKIISRKLQRHTKNFVRNWKKYHIDCCKTTVKTILSGIDLFYVPDYEVRITSNNMAELRLSKKVISYIIYYNGHSFLGCYNIDNSATMRINSNESSLNDKINYIVSTRRFAEVDTSFMIDFFDKGFQVFSLSNIKGGEKLWFSSDGSKPIRFDKESIISQIINWNDISKYKTDLIGE